MYRSERCDRRWPPLVQHTVTPREYQAVSMPQRTRRSAKKANSDRPRRAPRSQEAPFRCRLFQPYPSRHSRYLLRPSSPSLTHPGEEGYGATLSAYAVLYSTHCSALTWAEQEVFCGLFAASISCSLWRSFGPHSQRSRPRAITNSATCAQPRRMPEWTPCSWQRYQIERDFGDGSCLPGDPAVWRATVAKLRSHPAILSRRYE